MYFRFMKPAALSTYFCPDCQSSELKLAQGAVADEIVDGTLHCETCNHDYPIKGGIPRFVPFENYANSFGYQWNIHRKTQLDSFTGIPISRTRVFGVTGWSQDLSGQRILEAGSGAGRFTEILLKTGAEVFSLDYSNAVEANWSNNSNAGRLNLCQADIFNLPFRKKAFDKVLCIGVIQHTPDPEAAFKSLAQQVRPGGELVIDSYNAGLTSLLQWKYVLRPITKKMKKEQLYKIVSKAVPVLLPATSLLSKLSGRAGARLSPILDYSHLGLPSELNTQWAILDTFDMYSPAHDHPQTVKTIRRWFNEAGFEQIVVQRGPNGVVGKGIASKA